MEYLHLHGQRVLLPVRSAAVRELAADQGDGTTSAATESLVLHHLNLRMQESGQAVTRIRRDDLLPERQRGDVTPGDWAAAVERLLDTGKILIYKINDLPESLPLLTHNQSGYATPEHLLGLLKKACGTQAEDLRDYLEYQGVNMPETKIRTAVTAAQKKRIDAAVRKLNEVRAEVADRNPENRVTWYLDGTQNFCLMVEPDGQMEMRQEDIAHQVRLRASGGGDW